MLHAGTICYLALGTNLGDRLGFLRQAVAALRADVHVLRMSPVFETDAVAATVQPAYLNAVLQVQTTLPPDALLALGLGIERTLGRTRPVGISPAPRTIDIDILLYGDLQLATADLTIPHPRLLERPFVRIPLAHVAAAGLRHPGTGRPLDESTGDPGVRRLCDGF